jgi:hypothetical protein
MNPCFAEITLNGTYEIDSGNIIGLKIISDLEEGLPHGYFDLNDNNGEIFANFQNLSIGSTVQINIFNFDISAKARVNKTEPVFVEYPEFYILRLYNDGSGNPGAMSGDIRVYFGHPWFLFKDVKNHAYAPAKISELIKKITKSEDRGLAFDVEDANFSTTDDSGSITRYKSCETDWDFIQNKLMPYAMSSENPLHYFITDRGKIYLKSFKNMYVQKAKAIYAPPTNSISPEIITAMQKAREKDGIDEAFGTVNTFEIEVYISNDKLNSELSPNFYLENTVNGTGITGGKLLANKLAPMMGPSFGNLIPLNFTFPFKSKGTSCKVVHNRPLNDSLALLFSSASVVDDIFTVIMSTDYIGNLVSIGDTVQIFFDKVKEDKKKLTHWLQGKWVVKRTEHIQDSEDKTKFSTRSVLARSNFVGNKETTSLKDVSFLYASP